MNDSILETIRNLILDDDSCHHFDKQLVVHINTFLSVLTQIGVGPSEGFFISDGSTKWSEFLQGENAKLLESVKTYIYLRVKNVFDPPSPAMVESNNRVANEIEWRLNATVDAAYNEKN